MVTFVTVIPVSLKSGLPELVADGRLPQQARSAGPSVPGIKAGSHSSARDTMLHNSYTDTDTVLRGQQVTHWDDNSSLVNTTHTHIHTHNAHIHRRQEMHSLNGTLSRHFLALCCKNPINGTFLRMSGHITSLHPILKNSVKHIWP